MRTPRIPAGLLLVGALAGPVRAQPGADGVVIQDRSTVDENGVRHDAWVPRDGQGVPLRSEEFYRRIGRPDLVEARDHRRVAAIGTLVGGLAIAGVGVYYASQAMASPSLQTCDATSSYATFSACVMSNQSATQATRRQTESAAPIAIGASLAGALVLGVSTYFFMNPEPISEIEAERLAADYNRRHVVGVAPYATSGGGGLAVAGRF